MTVNAKEHHNCKPLHDSNVQQEQQTVARYARPTTSRRGGGGGGNNGKGQGEETRIVASGPHNLTKVLSMELYFSESEVS